MQIFLSVMLEQGHLFKNSIDLFLVLLTNLFIFIQAHKHLQI